MAACSHQSSDLSQQLDCTSRAVDFFHGFWPSGGGGGFGAPWALQGFQASRLSGLNNVRVRFVQYSVVGPMLSKECLFGVSGFSTSL